MSLSVGVGGVWKDVPTWNTGVGGVWKVVQAAWVGVSGVWKLFYGIIISLDYTTADGTNIGSGTITATTNDVTISTVSGATISSYTWQYVSGAVSFTIHPGSNVATVNWSNSGTVSPGTPEIDYSAIWHCKVTDVNGLSVYSPNVTVTVELYYSV